MERCCVCGHLGPYVVERKAEVIYYNCEECGTLLDMDAEVDNSHISYEKCELTGTGYCIDAKLDCKDCSLLPF